MQVVSKLITTTESKVPGESACRVNQVCGIVPDPEKVRGKLPFASGLGTSPTTKDSIITRKMKSASQTIPVPRLHGDEP